MQPLSLLQLHHSASLSPPRLAQLPQLHIAPRKGVEDVHIFKEEKHGTFLIVSDSMFDLWHGCLTYLSTTPLSRPPPHSQQGLVEYEGDDTVTEETLNLNIMLEDNSIYEIEDADEDWNWKARK